jgi:putative nucleotidyltransferase with HDIG domain
MSDPALKNKAFLIGLDAAGKEAVARRLKPTDLVEAAYDLEKLSETAIEPPPFAVICGNPPEGISLVEVAQLLRMQYQESAIYLLTTKREGFERKDFQKNGFTDAFLLPFDNSTFDGMLEADISKASQGAIKSYRSVKLLDLQPGQVMEFNTYVYLPANKKHVLYSAAGDAIDEKRAARLQQHSVSQMHVQTGDMQKFYDFTAKQLKDLKNAPGLSETERQHRLQGSVRELLSGIFSESAQGADTVKGRQVINDCQAIVKSYILDGGAKTSWYERMLSITGSETNAYNHQSNVATYASLFSMALGIDKPEELALAGLLHDIGLANVPFEIQAKSEAERTPEEEKIYRQHTQFSLDIIRDRKLIVSDTVLKIISQHHEKFNGMGYPAGKSGKSIAKGATLLAIADELDYLTSAQNGKAPMKLLDAVHQIHQKSAFESTTCEYDPEIVKEVIKIFPQRAETKAA